MFPVRGEKKTVYENGCKLNLMVWGWVISRILCSYKYVKVVLNALPDDGVTAPKHVRAILM